MTSTMLRAMENSVATTVLLPVALGIIMLGLGLSLTIADFKRVAEYPRAVVVAMVCQLLVLPAACFGLVSVLGLPGELAVGMMLLAASPGGATANLFSHLARGDVALNITLTAVNSLLSLITLPLLVNASVHAFMANDASIGLQFSKVVQVFAIVLIPVGIGMLIHAKKPGVATSLERPVRVLSALFLVAIVVSSIVKERENIGLWFAQVGLAALLFNLVSLGVGYFVPKLARVPERQSVAIGMEIGIHNATLAIAIASSPTLLNNTAMSIPAAVYSLIMFFTAAVFGWFVSRRTSA